MQRRPRILLTNDDGIHAPGIYNLWQGLKNTCDLTIVAPEDDKSGSGLSITTSRPLHIQQLRWEDERTKAYKVNGTPTDCIKLALSIVCEHPPDLIASGINQGANSGRNILYSGTVAGVIEGTLRNVPGIAFSCDNFEEPNFARAASYVYPFVKYLLEHPLPRGSFLNVTFPDHKGPVKGIRLAKQGRGYWVENPEARQHPQGHSYYWLGGQRQNHEEHEESDVELIKQGFLTAVPIQIHELTDHAQYEMRKPVFENWFSENS